MVREGALTATGMTSSAPGLECIQGLQCEVKGGWSSDKSYGIGQGQRQFWRAVLLWGFWSRDQQLWEALEWCPEPWAGWPQH